MANEPRENAAYLDFLNHLNEILAGFEINKLSCS